MAADGVGGGHLGSVRLSSPPAYEQVALWAVVEAWLLASLVGVAAAAVGGLVAARSLTRPLLALTSASDRMAGGDLAARAPVDRDDELGRLAVSFNAMAGRNEETVGTLRRFVADAAHEIGTPLTALQADLELAEAGATPDQRRLLDRAMGQAERLGALSSGLLRLARIEAGDGPLGRDPVDVAALAAFAADAAASRVDQAELTLAVDTPGAPVLVLGDADRLRTAVGYLLDNAVKFTPAGGAIRLSVRVEDRWAILLVDDTGIGIPADDLDGLFERFHRGRNASAYPGSGLGLAIVRATAVGHGGAVRAERLEPGTRAELRLPLA